MTLDTRIALLGPAKPEEVFQFARDLLRAPDRVPVKREPGTYGRENQEQWSHPPGQGLNAWLFMYVAVDGPIRYTWRYDDPESGAHDLNGKDIFIEVSFDTAYGYEAPNGAHCTDLHAYLVEEFVRWGAERDIEVWWENEMTGDWSQGTNGLGDFGNPYKGREGIEAEFGPVPVREGA